MSALSIVNMIGFHYLFEFSEDIDFIVDISLAVILVAVVVPLIIILLKSRKSLIHLKYASIPFSLIW